MKTNKMRWIVAAIVLFSSTVLWSFSPKGGDSFEIYLNGRLLVQQYVHVDKTVKSLEISELSSSDKLDIYYRHCGQIGKDRFITIKDEKEHPLKVWRFVDGSYNKEAMTILLKDIPGIGKNTRLNIYYSSRELPEGKELASLRLTGEGMARK
jgi:hypothetical protein